MGEGPDVVFIHGLAGSNRWWARNVEALSATYRVFALDLAGFGASRRGTRFRLDTAVAMVADWLHTQALDSVSIIGHSMGGLIAARLAADDPKCVKRLVLVDAAFLSLDPGIARPVRGLLKAARMSSRDLRKLVARDSLRADPLSLGRATVDVLTVNWQSELTKIQVPTLIIWGEQDTVTPLSIGKRLADLIEDSKLVVIADAGHVPMWDQANRFNEEIRAFLGPASDREISDQ
jgi:pimeloyl-ACP methyl ester carboxylesterase